MKRILLLAVLSVLVFAGSTALADEASYKKAVLRLLEVTYPKNAPNQPAKPLEDAVIQRLDQDTEGLPPVARLAARIQIRKWFSENMSLDQLKDSYVEIYARIFTEEEINALTQFNETPSGRAITRKMPALLMAIAPKIEEFAQKKWPELQETIDRTLTDLRARYRAEDAQSPETPPKTGEQVRSGSTFRADFHDAAEQGDLEKIRTLLKDNPGLVSSKDDNGEMPLHRAVKQNQKEVVTFLLASGADVNARTNYGVTPLHEAAGWGHKDVVALLVARRADVNVRNERDATPLYEAAGYGYIDIMALLLASGADVNAGGGGDTPLHRAAEQSQKGAAELLLAKGANVNARNERGETPLYYAAGRGQKDVAELLIVKGADVNARQKTVNGWTPLHYAAHSGHKDVVVLLLANGAHINARDNGDHTPLHWAAELYRKDVVAALIANKADLNARDRMGWTPLSAAAFRGNKEVVELLRQHGGKE